MSMFGDISIEATVEVIVIEIEKTMKENKGKPDALAALKKVGRSALVRLRTSPKWEKKFQRLFKE